MAVQARLNFSSLLTSFVSFAQSLRIYRGKAGPGASLFRLIFLSIRITPQNRAKPCFMTIQMQPIAQSFLVILFLMLYWVVLTSHIAEVC